MPADFSLIEILFRRKEITGLKALQDVLKSAHPAPRHASDMRVQGP
jgi:hypothetical protein